MTTDNAWFAARPSGTEDVYKIYAESFRGPDHLRQVQEEAKTVVLTALPAQHRHTTARATSRWPGPDGFSWYRRTGRHPARSHPTGPRPAGLPHERGHISRGYRFAGGGTRYRTLGGRSDPGRTVT
ncbi:hypothetical protein SVIOM74S_09846 [Streptomyces violarus]